VKACTIVAENYLPAARVLANSFLEHHPDASFTILLLDATAHDISSEDFEVLSPYDIGIDRREVHRMAMIYDVKELATAVKPWLLRTRLTRGAADAVFYLDPDIEIFAPLGDVAELAREHSIVLTPHITAPLPADGLLPDDVMILQAGTYNLGFIGVGPGATEFLDWWSARLARDCRVAIDRGQFVDQRWVDLVPVFFEHAVLRDPTCNVAYWNLHERSFRWSGERYEVDGMPLRFFHFSGFDPTKPELLSTHLGPWTRVLLSDHPDLARLCREYGQRLVDRGYIREKSLPYRFDSTASGLRVDPRIRNLYREALEDSGRDRGPEPPDPFDSASADAFLDWLNEPAGPGGLSRYLHAMYRERPDVQAAFPLVGHVHRDRFLHWVATVGRHEEKIPPELLPAGASRPTARAMSKVMRAGVSFEERLRGAATRYPLLLKAAPFYRAIRRIASWVRHGSGPDPERGRERLALDIASDPRRGINAVGYLRAELGVGELARRLIAGIEKASVPFSTITYGNTLSRQEFPFNERNGQCVPYDTNLVCVNADQMPGFASAAGPAFFSNRYTIGVWSWELEVFPTEFQGAFEFVDEVWVPTDFMQRAIAPAMTKPVLTVPVPLEAAAARPIERATLGLPQSFLFFFTFDFMSVVERKNPLGLIAAFKRAFEPSEGVALVLKSINGEQNFAALERIRIAASDHADIIVMDGYLGPETKDGLMATCDCYVSLHRSEGLGFTIAEAMSYGRPVIATGYSGNLTFMDEKNSYLVPYALTGVPPGCDPYPAGALWAEPDLDRAAALMRHVYENQDEARRLGQRARHDIVTHHSPDRTGEFITSRFAEIHSGRGSK
jgi:glycosyltransferase involved in cell wall biosynthesis